GTATTNPKYCSLSCAATVNNRGVRRHGTAPGECRQCRKPLTNSASEYCSGACHHEVLAERHIKRWLVTGNPGAHTLKRAIRDWIMMQQNGVCAICGREPTWNGATLVFVLDHIDGDNGRHFRRERYRAGLSD
ncbi:hypothetical protein, partial [Pseudolysinimonas sp.]|uniref:hypothetical protein n=1 Tax=Pseudolysinimonas sp. TaxID=2680009 RepID=UPI0037844C4F